MIVVSEPFEIPGDLGPIRGDVRRPAIDGPLPAVVLLHGFKGFKDFAFFPYMAETFASAGIVSVIFNFSGNGIGADPQRFTELDKFAKNSISSMLRDLALVLAAVRGGAIAAGVDFERIGVFGHSMGGGLAILEASKDASIRCVAAWGTVSRFDRFTDEEMRLWRERGYHEVVNKRTGQVFRMGRGWVEDLEAHREELDVLSAARRLRRPLLLVHGAEDETVPVEESRAIEEAARTTGGRIERLVIAGAGHTFGAVHPFPGTTTALEEARRETLRFIAESLLSGKGGRP